MYDAVPFKRCWKQINYFYIFFWKQINWFSISTVPYKDALNLTKQFNKVGYVLIFWISEFYFTNIF